MHALPSQHGRSLSRLLILHLVQSRQHPQRGENHLRPVLSLNLCPLWNDDLLPLHPTRSVRPRRRLLLLRRSGWKNPEPKPLQHRKLPHQHLLDRRYRHLYALRDQQLQVSERASERTSEINVVSLVLCLLNLLTLISCFAINAATPAPRFVTAAALARNTTERNTHSARLDPSRRMA